MDSDIEGYSTRPDYPLPHRADRLASYTGDPAMSRFFLVVALLASAPALAQETKKKSDGNRLAYLDEVNPYYPHKDFAKLITPQWVGENGVEAVVILGIDDMTAPKEYEEFLRPILNRLKKV